MDAGGNEKMRNGKDVQEFYNKYPFPNDKVQSVESLERHSWILKVLKEPISPESTILDVGCGTGEMSIFLANRFESIRIKVIGADFTPDSFLRGGSQQCAKAPDQERKLLTARYH